IVGDGGLFSPSVALEKTWKSYMAAAVRSKYGCLQSETTWRRLAANLSALTRGGGDAASVTAAFLVQSICKSPIYITGDAPLLILEPDEDHKHDGAQDQQEPPTVTSDHHPDGGSFSRNTRSARLDISQQEKHESRF